jgi:hypothetical protein
MPSPVRGIGRTTIGLHIDGLGKLPSPDEDPGGSLMAMRFGVIRPIACLAEGFETVAKVDLGKGGGRRATQEADDGRFRGARHTARDELAIELEGKKSDIHGTLVSGSSMRSTSNEQPGIQSWWQ